MDAGISSWTVVKGTGISFVFIGIALFALGIIQRVQVAPNLVPLPAAGTAVPITGNKVVPFPDYIPPPPEDHPSEDHGSEDHSSEDPIAPAPFINAAPLHKAEPQYSSEARNAKYEGTVHVSVLIDEDGEVGDIEILDSPGLGLDEKIIESLHKWKFRPATRGGVPVTEKATIAITFKLL